MKIALIASGYENLGIEAISAYLKREGHNVKLFFDPQTFGGGIFLRIDLLKNILDLQDEIVTQVVLWNPDIIGFSCMTHNYQWSLKLASKIKERAKDIPIIFGGIQPTSIPNEVLANKCVDMVAVGEAELSLSSLLDNMGKGTFRTDIKGIYFKQDNRVISNPVQPLITDLDSLPFLDKDIFYEKIPAMKKVSYATMASKGCPFTCTYCCNDFLKNLYKGYKFCRKRSVNHVISELKEAKQKFNFTKVYFYDEVFPSELSWLDEFSGRYKQEIGVPFKLYYHFKLTDEKRIKLLKDAGCQLITFGLQSVSYRVRREICNRIYTNDVIESAVRICKKYDLDVIVDHIFGLPGETEPEQKEAVEFYSKLSPKIVYSYWLTYYPKTSIIDKAIEHNLLSIEDVEKINNGENSYYYKPTLVKNKKSLAKYQTLFDLIPLLPSKIHKLISENDSLINILPSGFFTHFFLLSVANLRLKHIFSYSFENLRLIFARKYVP